MIGIVQAGHQEGEEEDEEAECVPEQEGVPGVIVGSHSSVHSTGG